MKHLYFRCNGGHYFRAAIACPFDGWSCEALELTIQTFEALLTAGTPTIEALKDAGIPSEVIQRVLLIEFGNESSAFDALVPERYIHGGREIMADVVDLELF